MFLPKYTYPDGTESLTPPADGQVFYIYDAYQTVSGIYQYDDFMKQWFDITPAHGTHQMTVRVPAAINFIDLKIELDLPKCECGSEKTGSNRHSTWCQKFTAQS